ncbi:MAG: glycosyltransferase family 4 protein [Chthoniobacterales bacterium]
MSTPPGLLSSAYFNTFEAARSIYHAYRRRSFRSQLFSVSIDGAQKDLRLNYGHIANTDKNDIVIGGNVKLLHLQERFPQHLNDFNLLYLVSSAPVPYWEDLVSFAKSKGCKFVWNQNGVAYRSWCGDYYPWFNAPLKNLIKQADYVVYQSEFCRLCADRYLTPVDAPNEILFNPVDLEAFHPTETPLPSEPWELLAAGTSHHFYRVKSALDCLSHLLKNGCHARLTIAGEFRWKSGEQEVDAYLEHMELRAHVRILPPFTQAEAPEIYRAAHLLIHPKYKDPCPTVPIEAMASGIPVVGSKSGGMPELVPPNCGILVDVEENWDIDIAPDALKMADAIKKIFSDYSAYAQATRRHAESTFDKNRWVDAHAAIFNKVLNP